jgi:hypothetical protein
MHTRQEAFILPSDTATVTESKVAQRRILIRGKLLGFISQDPTVKTIYNNLHTLSLSFRVELSCKQSAVKKIHAIELSLIVHLLC